MTTSNQDVCVSFGLTQVTDRMTRQPFSQGLALDRVRSVDLCVREGGPVVPCLGLVQLSIGGPGVLEP